MEDEHVRQLRQLGLDLGLALLLAFLALVLVAPLERVLLEEGGDALVEGGLEGDAEGHEGVKSYRFFIAPTADHYRLLQTRKQLVDHRGVGLLILVPCDLLGSPAWIASNGCLLHPLGIGGRFLILEGRHDVGEEFVAVMLEHRRKFIIYLLFDILRGYNYGRGPASASSAPLILLFFQVLLVVFLEENQLIEF